MHDVTGSTGTLRNFFISVAATNVTLRNNIFSMRGSGTGVKMNIYMTNVTATSFVSNNNVFFNDATGGTNVLGYWSANRATLNDWIAASGRDSLSSSNNPALTNVAAGLLTPLSANIDNFGAPMGVTTDITGAPRSLTTPDVGAIEFTGLSSDMRIERGSLKRSTLCYNTNDSVFITVKNVFGSTVNFNTNPLTVVYEVTGPVNTTDSIIIFNDTLAVGDEKTVFANNISSLQPGTYTLNAYIRPNGVNTSLANDTLFTPYELIVQPILSAMPKTFVANTPTDSFIVSAESPFLNKPQIKFTEICHFKTGTGAPTNGWPSYLLADDYLELTSIPGTTLEGYTLEEWNTTGLMHSATFGPSVKFGPNGTLILAHGQLGSSIPQPDSFYFHTGNTATHGSTVVMAYLLKDQDGNIVDATVYGNVAFPAASGVSSADWSGITPSVSSSGNRLAGPDTNDPTNWINSGTSPQDPNVLNSGVPIPTPPSNPNFIWTYLGNLYDSAYRTHFGPYTTPGIYRYVAQINTPCGFYTDTVTVTANSTVPVKLLTLSAKANGNDANITWSTASELNSSRFEVLRSYDGKNFVTVGSVKAAGNSRNTTTYTFTDKNALQRGGYVYYQLRMVDMDETYEMSQVVSVMTKLSENGMVVYPNPTNGLINVVSNATSEGLTEISIVNLSGKEVLKVLKNSVVGLNQYTLDIDLPGGVYMILMNQNGNITSQKLVVQP